MVTYILVFYRRGWVEVFYKPLTFNEFYMFLYHKNYYFGIYSTFLLLVQEDLEGLVGLGVREAQGVQLHLELQLVLKFNPLKNWYSNWTHLLKAHLGEKKVVFPKSKLKSSKSHPENSDWTHLKAHLGEKKVVFSQK